MVVRSVAARKAGRVLVINSDPEITRILEVNLAQANLEIISAPNGSEALKKIQTNKTDIIILDPALPDIEATEIYERITSSSQTNHIPVILISARLPRKHRIARAEEIPIYHVTKPFDPKEVVALVQGYLIHKERMVHINPLTGLPNRLQISKELDRVIRQKKTFAAIYIVLHDLKAINNTYGYAQGDSVVQRLADIVSEAVHLYGNAEDLAGYFGGDKFVVISTPSKARTLCRKIIADFDKRIPAPRDEKSPRVSIKAPKSRSLVREQAPAMSIHVAVVMGQKRMFRHSFEVTEAASEQIEFLRQSPESNCYFDLRASEVEPSLALSRRELAPAYKEGLKTIHGVLAWLDFLARELDTPMKVMRDCLDSLKSGGATNLSQEQINSLKALHNNHNQIIRIAECIGNLTRFQDETDVGSHDEVDIGDILAWVIEHVQELAEPKEIKINLEVTGEIGRIIRDKKSLMRSLLYLIRGEIRSSLPESHLLIRLMEKNEEHIHIEINNPKHHISPRELNTLFEKQSDASRQENMSANELYPARVLMRGIGGDVQAISERKKGLTYFITIPKKWRSWMPEVETLQLAMEISRKEAREALKSINQIVSSIKGRVPATIKESIEILSRKVQEMGVLCNRSLFLADDLSNRLESQQDRLLQQEVERLTTLEAILTSCREMVRTTHARNIFEPDSVKRVAKYALSIAGEFKISESERQALRYGALFKDLGLALSLKDMMEQKVASTFEEAAVIKAQCDLVGKALATVPFFDPAMDFVRYRYERHDGKGGRFGIKGTDIPLGARILAVADTYDAMTSGRSPQGKLTPKLAMQKISEESGMRFDPRVVSAFLMLWKRKELGSALIEN